MPLTSAGGAGSPALPARQCSAAALREAQRRIWLWITTGQGWRVSLGSFSCAATTNVITLWNEMQYVQLDGSSGMRCEIGMPGLRLLLQLFVCLVSRGHEEWRQSWSAFGHNLDSMGHNTTQVQSVGDGCSGTSGAHGLANVRTVIDVAIAMLPWDQNWEQEDCGWPCRAIGCGMCWSNTESTGLRRRPPPATAARVGVGRRARTRVPDYQAGQQHSWGFQAG